MCIAFWLLDQHPSFWLILALNRDEVHARPTLPFHFWEEDDDVKNRDGRAKILAGRDLRSGGTWMGLTKTGRLAFLTNVRENDWTDRTDRTSRGDLTTRFLSGDQTPHEFADMIAQEAHNYNGFNLVVADFTHGEMAFVSNRHGQSGRGDANPTVVRKIAPGLHSLSNGTLDGKWKKMVKGKKLFGDIVVKPDGEEKSSVSMDHGNEVVPNERIVETVLRDSERAEDVSEQIKETQCRVDWEVPLSSIFVEKGLEGTKYGTRSMAVVGIRRDGLVSLFERYLEVEAGEWKDHSFQFQVEDGEGQVH
ncbi:unnamed protein product [Calypogeia fissa]